MNKNNTNTLPGYQELSFPTEVLDLCAGDLVVGVGTALDWLPTYLVLEGSRSMSSDPVIFWAYDVRMKQVRMRTLHARFPISPSGYLSPPRWVVFRPSPPPGSCKLFTDKVR